MSGSYAPHSVADPAEVPYSGVTAIEGGPFKPTAITRRCFGFAAAPLGLSLFSSPTEGESGKPVKPRKGRSDRKSWLQWCFRSAVALSGL